jgi:DNA transformation protein and related proteins
MTPETALLGTVLDLLSAMGTLRQRKMFGSVYIYCDDLFIATIHDETLYFKANATTAPDFVERGLPIFSYPKQGGIATLQYYQAPPEVLTGPAAMKLWADKALLAAKQDAAAKPRKAGGGLKASTPSNKKAMKATRRDA